MKESSKARAALFTGQYPHQVDMMPNSDTHRSRLHRWMVATDDPLLPSFTSQMGKGTNERLCPLPPAAALALRMGDELRARTVDIRHATC